MVKLGIAPLILHLNKAFFHVKVNNLFPMIINKTVKVFCISESRDQMDFYSRSCIRVPVRMHVWSITQYLVAKNQFLGMVSYCAYKFQFRLLESSASTL